MKESNTINNMHLMNDRNTNMKIAIGKGIGNYLYEASTSQSDLFCFFLFEQLRRQCN